MKQNKADLNGRILEGLIVGLAVSNPDGGVVVLYFRFVYCVGSVRCDGLITLSEEFYRLCDCVTQKPNN